MKKFCQQPQNSRGLDLGGINVEPYKNSTRLHHAVNREANDDSLELIAWLANHLAPYGLALEEGNRGITGSITKPI